MSREIHLNFDFNNLAPDSNADKHFPCNSSLVFIAANTGVNINQNDVLSFSTNGFNFPKHRVLLTRMIPGNANQFHNGSLTVEEQVKKANESAWLTHQP